MNLQTYWFHQALEEIGLSSKDARTDHYSGRCYHPAIGQRGLIFPESHLRKIRHLSRYKTQDYFFMGNLNSKSRDWVRRYPNVTESLYGRDKSVKYNFHLNYYQSMSSSKFVLAPVGDCPWSYRLFEAVICEALPIIGKHERDIYSSSFFYFKDDQTHNYDQVMVKRNWTVFLKDHTLRDFNSYKSHF